ncbi:MAG: hypothetical protein V8Q79_02750 [Christensenellales bacterium]
MELLSSKSMRPILAELFGFLIDGLGELSDIRPAVYHVALQVIGALATIWLRIERSFLFSCE